MKALSDYVHGKGLKLGIYSDAGYAQLTIEKPQSHKKAFRKMRLAEAEIQWKI
jgi:hypothetical protein